MFASKSAALYAGKCRCLPHKVPLFFHPIQATSIISRNMLIIKDLTFFLFNFNKNDNTSRNVVEKLTD